MGELAVLKVQSPSLSQFTAIVLVKDRFIIRWVESEKLEVVGELRWVPSVTISGIHRAECAMPEMRQASSGRVKLGSDGVMAE